MRGWMGGLATADFPRSEPCPVALRLPGLRSCRLLQAQRPGEFPQTVPRTCRAPGLPGLRSCRPLQAQSRPANSRRWCSKPARALAYRAYGLVGCCKRSGPASSRRRCRAPARVLAYRVYGLVGRCKRSAARQYALLEVFAVAGNHLLVPPERFFTLALQRAVTGIIAIDIDKAVALAHLAG